MICNNFRVDGSSISSNSASPNASLAHPRSHPSHHETERTGETVLTLHRNRLHHPRHGRQLRPLGILPSRDQPGFLQSSRKQRNNERSNKAYGKGRKKLRFADSSLPSTLVCSISVADVRTLCALSKILLSAKMFLVSIVFSWTIGGSVVLFLTGFT